MEFVNKVFIYGNNKKSQKILDQIDYVDYLGTGETIAAFDMVNLGGYPGILYNTDKKYKILGDVYSVTREQLKDLDQLKGEGVIFERVLEQIFVINNNPRRNGVLLQAWVYILQEIPPIYDYSNIFLTTKNYLTYERI
jgi:gamma-glutamylcyclotransferase (GGCT)/AIG2-like uncharacterized protein YtfP